MVNSDNYTRIPNEILEALYTYNLPPLYIKIALYVLRKTHGWGKPSDKISISKMARDMFKTRPRVSNAIRDMEASGILYVERVTNGKPPEMQVRNPKEWDKPVLLVEHVPLGEHVPSEAHNLCRTRHTPCAVEGTGTCAARGTHKRKERNYTKDTLQKKEPPAPEIDGYAPLTEEELIAGGWGFD